MLYFLAEVYDRCDTASFQGMLEKWFVRLAAGGFNRNESVPLSSLTISSSLSVKMALPRSLMQRQDDNSQNQLEFVGKLGVAPSLRVAI